jgi:hypothetical protein
MPDESVPANAPLAKQHAAGLRALADMVEQNPDLVQFAIMNGLFAFYVKSAEDQAALARAALRHGAKVDKDITDLQHNLLLTWGPVSTYVLASRGDVCERVVTGVQTVTKTVKDPLALATLPDIESTEEVEVFEWKCQPLLSALDEQTAQVAS